MLVAVPARLRDLDLIQVKCKGRRFTQHLHHHTNRPFFNVETLDDGSAPCERACRNLNSVPHLHRTIQP
jgi:hypothetical protein